jgi:hypothetical protein
LITTDRGEILPLSSRVPCFDQTPHVGNREGIVAA